MISVGVSPSFTTENTMTVTNEATTNPKMKTSQKYGTTETGIQHNRIRCTN